MIFSNFHLNEDEPIYLQIQKLIIDNIKSGMAVSGGKLPSTRELCKLLGVSRNSVLSAYENLEAEGIIYTIKGKGTFISESITKSNNGLKISWCEKVNNYGNMAKELDIVKSEIPWNRGLISFKSISPDGDSFDVEEFKKAFLNRISVEGHKILNYGYAKGYKPLMDYLMAYMREKGVNTNGKDIIITNGFTEGLEMIISTFTQNGDKIICENPTHNTSIKIMKVNEIEIVGVKMTADGIDIKELEEALKVNNIKFGYLVPSYHNPTGIVTKAEKRKNIYNLFKEYNVPIIEDGFNEELLYNSTHISPLAALDNGGNGVVYIGSFSKILFPGIRVGWLIADKKVIDTLESVKRCKNIHTSFLDQGILYEYLNSGAFNRHVKKVRKLYKERFEFANKCIEEYIKPDYIWGEGGLHIYIGFKNINARKLLEETYRTGVIFTPGDIFSIDNSCDNELRLGLSRVTLEEIEEGIKIIGESVNKLKSKSE